MPEDLGKNKVFIEASFVRTLPGKIIYADVSEAKMQSVQKRPKLINSFFNGNILFKSSELSILADKNNYRGL